MPKRYEEEINEILHRYDWPPSPRGRSQGQRRTGQDDLSGALGRLFSGFNPNQLMILGIILILAGAVIRFLGLGLGVALGGDATLVGVVALLGGYVLAVASARRSLGSRPRMWRGQVVDLPPRGRGLDYWWWRFTRSFRRR